MNFHTCRIAFIFSFLICPFLMKSQRVEDLGRTQPFLIGLKGTIYNFEFPKLNARSRDIKAIGYTPQIENTEPIGYVYTQSLNISDRDLNMPFPGVPAGKRVFAIIYTGNFEVSDSAEYFFGLQ